MTVLTIIAGICLIITGVAVFFTPVETFFAVGLFLAILFMVYGIFGIIKAFQGRSNIWEILLDILAIIVGVACIFKPGAALKFDTVLLYIIAAWFLVEGIFTIIMSIRTKAFNFMWFFGVLIGILSIILAIVSLFNPLFEASVLGVIIGFYFIESGLDMILLGSITGSLKKQAEMIKDEAERWASNSRHIDVQ
jgi:uncharacterized membrane protein HdeD (DUF308 family)